MEDKKHGSKNRHKDERSQVNKKETHHTKRRAEEIEQLEKSSLTEEHGQPTQLQSLYDSSDSTQNSGKRKRQDTPADTGHNHGSGLRIRLPLLKHKDPELPNNEQPCSSGLVKPKDPKLHGNEQQSCSSVLLKQKDPELPNNGQRPPCSSGLLKPKNPELCGNEQQQFCSSVLLKQDTALPSNEQQPPCSSRRSEIPAMEPENSGRKRTHSSESAAQKMEVRFRDLTENWNPPFQSLHQDFDDEGWLFERKQPQKQEAKRCKVIDGSCSLTAGERPCATYLAEADIYALPYVLPF
ncbi:uncharacterized protein LOC143854142 isoform X2 [Tasmannia lanceolata]